jgi:predicted hotdog family 3-hydroxylacyl-ACP dehydratase
LDELLPHRPPMRLLRAVLAHSPGETRCEARFDEAFAQACGGEPSAAFALELIAQAAAVHHGLLQRRQPENRTLPRPRRGLLLGSRRLELCVRVLPVGEALTVFVLGGESPPGVGGLIRFEGRVEDSAGRVLARGDATVLEELPEAQLA